MTTSHNVNAYNVYEVGFCKNQHYSRCQTRNNSRDDKGRIKSRKKNMECHYCHKKGHLKKDFYDMKNMEKDNVEFKSSGHARQSSGLFLGGNRGSKCNM